MKTIKKLRSITIFSASILIAVFAVSACSSIKFVQHYVPHKPKSLNVKKNKLALVLGGGGAKGFAHVGVIEELEKAGIVPDLIVGCSAGAIIGGLYAANPDAQALKKLVLSGKRSDVISVSTDDWPYSIYSKSQLAKYLAKNIKVDKFQDLKMPLVVTATNLQFGNVTVFSHGDVIQPILASAAFPGAFGPIEIEGQYFVDCAVSDPVPVRVARDLGMQTIVAVNIAEQLPDTSPTNILGLMKRSMEIAYLNQSKYSVEHADVVIDFHFKNIGLFTDEYNDYLYQEGLKAGKKAVPAILEKLKRL